MADDKRGSLLDVQLGSEGYGIIATPLSDKTQDTPNTDSSNEFYSSGAGGAMEGGTMSTTTTRHRIGGRTVNFLESKGFGWLLDSEEDEEGDKPLL